jgi:acyl-CoA thioester hydrolase
MLRALGLPYAELERDGYLLPVATASIKYLKGASYDDEITVTAEVEPKDSPRVEITYAVKNAAAELIATGETTLVFVSRESNKPCKPPKKYLDAFEKQ